MSLALKLYEQLTEAADERERFRLIANAIGTLEDTWPRPGEIARASDVRESELRLQKEIEIVRKEIAEVEGGLRKEIAEAEGRLRKEIELVRKETAEAEGRLRNELAEVDGRLRKEIAKVEGGLRKEIAEAEGRLRKEIELVRKEIAEVEGRLRKEIEQVRLETERVRGEIRAAETRLQQSMHRQTFWIIGAVGAVVGLIRLLDAVLP